MKQLFVMIALLLVTASRVASSEANYHFVVAQNGTGDFRTVQEAVNAVPDFRKGGPTRILIKKGIYKEKLIVPNTKDGVQLYGEDGVVLTYDDFASKPNVFGENMGTSGSSSVYIYGPNFLAENITFENSSGPVGQAVACFVGADRVVFRRCRFLGFQDTLYTFGENTREYYEDCYIEGTVDFIFGKATCVFNRCELRSKLSGGYLTAPATPQSASYGYVFFDCRMTADDGVKDGTVWLSRPWRPYAKCVFIRCEMGRHIRPEGWNNWGNPANKQTAYYAEYQSSGDGGRTDRRVAWSHQLTNTSRYDIQTILAGSDGWQVPGQDSPVAADSKATFTNPIMGGDFPDPTILRDGDDYYMTHSAFDYVPGLTVFHSKDLVHWTPISYALKEYLGSIWAPDIKKYKGKYYIYFTVARRPRTNYVVVADSPYGPWSDPIDLKVDHIDPCHVVGEDGKRYLVLSGGDRVQLTDDGLAVVAGSMKHIYGGWRYPEDWVTEGFSLEGPKLYRIGKYFYYLSAEGGTAGPPTSHMITVARSEHIDGPWENMPTNPLVHTWNNIDRWWSKGHGSLVDTPDGQWHVVYHAYENGYLNLGRQTLMEPVHFTSDGWIAADGGDVSQPMAQPTKMWQPADRLARLGEFRIGLDWKYYKTFDPQRASVTDGVLTLQARGTDVVSSAPLMFVAGSHRYEIEAEITLEGDVRAGLVLYYNGQFNVGIGFDAKQRYRIRRNDAGRRGETNTNHLWLRLRNDNHVVTGYWSEDGQRWHKEQWGQEVSGFNHNTLYDFQSLLPGIFASGSGKAVFKNFKHRTIEE